MARKPEGTQDLFGAHMRAWLAMQDCARSVFGTYGFEPFETPTMEQLDVFVHGIGDTTDVVQKEMFRVLSAQNFQRALEAGTEQNLKASKRLALRPEGTAGFVRAVIENNLIPQGSSPVKAFYCGAMFRGERPAKGRLRQFHQVGAEVVGAEDPALDAELICMLMEFYQALGLAKDSTKLLINSIGDPHCRAEYKKKLSAYIHSHLDDMCEDCQVRSTTNPLRAFDCKNETCQEIMKDAPKIVDALCDDCAAHYAAVKHYLDEAHISYTEDPALVRGLDYYTRTVFEVHVEAGLGAQTAIGGGGRYDGLMEIEGGKPTPAIGFAVGFERVELALQAQGIELGGTHPACVYVVAATPEMRDAVFALCRQIRGAHIRCEADYQGRSMKSQMKQANKLNARITVLVGPDELAHNTVGLRDMQTHEQITVPCDAVVDELVARLNDDAFAQANFI